MIGTAPRSPTQETNHFSRAVKLLNGARPIHTAMGRAKRIIPTANAKPGSAISINSDGVTNKPSTKNMPICASHVMPSSTLRIA
ncbi:Uncharacterised protein [Vibrio cholerae]|uniref:Uncharacterized protein n=1 Tax=Vibrio cholerae TaxID=666 RepID=A0A655VW37_VIBCL|nr:Uncharacterised protein [Vibrio cholerae]CSB94719.1 Uncharacterised protein [Vibrio cholerae]CSD13581.1 Uncharacterised protein [Vibrio cholerae]CSD61186.1 Uncharacterised protein [Vibrio cholerae]CSD78861.1 Uncharacterised protein [Vibrio cholerae]